MTTEREFRRRVAVAEARIRRANETIEAVARVRSDPTAENIALLHELHARHEREAGRTATAEAAEERAAHARTHGDQPRVP